MNMIDKAARAVHAHITSHYTDKKWGELDGDSKEHYRNIVRAAFKALLEPTQDMIDAVTVISIELEGKVPHRKVYDAYIKTALGD